MINEVVVRGATHRFRSGRTVGPISFEVMSGQVLGLVGSNGSGKTTTLRMIAGLASIDGGEILCSGHPVRVGHLPGRLSGIIESPAFLESLSGRDNLRVAAGGEASRIDRIDDLLKEAGIHQHASRRVATYSQGMRQRLAIARALLSHPGVVVLGEPTNGLDPLGIRWLGDLVSRLATLGCAVIVASHLLHELQTIATDLAVLSEGRLLALGRTHELVTGSTSLEDLYLELMGDS